jgi:hypothetical protein
MEPLVQEPILTARSMRLRPLGKLPVLFSLRLNSIELTAASTALAENPLVARASSWVRISDST